MFGPHEAELTDARARVELLFFINLVLHVDLEDVTLVEECVHRLLLLAGVGSHEWFVDARTAG